MKAVVDGNCWEFDAYIDVNCELKRQLGVTHLPCTILLDEQQGLICRYNGYCAVADKMICEKLQDHSTALLE